MNDNFRMRWTAPVIAAALVVALLLGNTAFRGSGAIAVLRIENNTAYDVDVDISDAAGREWIALTTVSQHSVTRVEDVADQGRTWRFRFASQGVPGGDLAMSGRALADAGWRLIVPGEVSARLARAGAPLPPPRP
jgi:hypothetical protein